MLKACIRIVSCGKHGKNINRRTRILFDFNADIFSHSCKELSVFDQSLQDRPLYLKAANTKGNGKRGFREQVFARSISLKSLIDSPIKVWKFKARNVHVGALIRGNAFFNVRPLIYLAAKCWSMTMLMLINMH